MRTNKCRIILWGCGLWGREALKNIDRWKVADCEVIAFADHDPSKCGQSFEGYQVLSIDEVVHIEKNIDAIVICASKVAEIARQICPKVNVPVYKNLYTFAFQRASIDISGCCNARCKWCATGQLNRLGLQSKNYMNFETFKRVYHKLRTAGTVFPINEILLYSWGEPFLNPDYLDIIAYLSSNEQRFSISTNASVIKLAENSEYQYCDTVIFSLSGFSEASYRKIHGFDLEKIKENIGILINNMRQHGFRGTAKISFHVYHFNEHEMKDAETFATSLGIEFSPVRAYFASYKMSMQYLKGEMSEEMLKDAQNDLKLDSVKNLIRQRPNDFRCDVENMISVNAAGQIELCCCCDSSAEDYSWGSVDDLTDYAAWKKLREKMLVCDTCNECRNAGLDYWFFHNPTV